MSTKTIPAIVLGASGYVASEIIGLLFNHPSFWIEAIVSSTNAGKRLDEVFPHLTGPAGDLEFIALEAILPRIASNRQLAVFSAMPHGETAQVVRDLVAQSKGSLQLVDVSADFRFSDPEKYAQVYGKPHEAVDVLEGFFCGLPDLEKSTPDKMISHPGCFTTAASLALAPFYSLHIIQPSVFVSAVTGSTGAGRQPRAGTHHPERQSALWAYDALKHRHKPEMEMLMARLGGTAEIAFVPHSGPFSRGIHATLFATLTSPLKAEDLVEKVKEFYKDTPFIRVGTRMPSIKEVVGSNRCHIGIAVNGNQLVITSVIDNLVKGAAGGAVQWMNRLFELPQDDGLMNAVPGWV
ncbi:MAG: N-acetyl-gamma-glutamyl-phosphate reductase [Armatimonadetes bacterium]|nr:N-acetyl-gamma-glutamyl-phosphate reductase [Armatimonadota bacterium]